LLKTNRTGACVKIKTTARTPFFRQCAVVVAVTQLLSSLKAVLNVKPDNESGEVNASHHNSGGPMKAIYPALLVTCLGLALYSEAASNPISRAPKQGGTYLDLGGGYALPSDSDYNDLYHHGINGRFSLVYQQRSGLIWGVQYRLALRDAKSGDLDLEHWDHWFGLRLGYDLDRSSWREASINGLLYWTYAEIRQEGPACGYQGRCVWTVAEDEEAGFGLGISFVYTLQLSRTVGIGAEAEYNHSWLDYEQGPPLLPDDDGPHYMARSRIDNIGGFWLSPFVRFSF
jgi:hypothetical protein